MRPQPQDIHREVIMRKRTPFSDEPSWYAVWLGPPQGEESELLGRTERLPRPRYWRVHPVTGEFPQVKRGWLDTVEWLLEVRDGHRKTADSASAAEHEQVGEA